MHNTHKAKKLDLENPRYHSTVTTEIITVIISLMVRSCFFELERQNSTSGMIGRRIV